MILFGYTVTRPIKLGNWTLAAVVLSALLYLAVVIVLNFVAVGYQDVQITSNSYNPSVFLWYQHIIPNGWAPPTTVCNPPILTVNEVVTSHGIFNYLIQEVTESQTGQAVETFSYEADPLVNCTIPYLSIQFSNSGEAIAHVTCQTSGYELTLDFMYTGETSSGDQGPQTYTAPIPDLTQPLNITEVVGVYTALVTDFLLQFVFSDSSLGISPPSPITCLFMLDSLGNTSITVEVIGVIPLLQVFFDSTGDLVNYTIYHVSGELNNTTNFTLNDASNLREASSLLGVTYTVDQPGAPYIPGAPYMGENFWTTLNWVFTVWYWAALYDFGQLSDSTLDLEGIFSNNTLVQRYAAVANEFVFPVSEFLAPSYGTNLTTLPLNVTNKLEDVPTPLQQTYSCTQRQLRGWLTVAIFLIVADYTFALGAYNVFILIAGWWQKQKDDAEAKKTTEDAMGLEEVVALIADNDHHATEELQQENADRDQISDNSERESDTIVDKPEGEGGK